MAGLHNVQWTLSYKVEVGMDTCPRQNLLAKILGEPSMAVHAAVVPVEKRPCCRRMADKCRGCQDNGRASHLLIAQHETAPDGMRQRPPWENIGYQHSNG
jgi:hypothetical protein